MSHTTRTAVSSWIFFLAIMLTATSAGAANTPMQIGRYSIIPAVATAAQADPLQTMVQIHFPAPHISTAGEAVHYLLRNSGYRLAEPEASDPAMAGLLNHLLPKVHRHLGPMTLQAMLSTLAGNAYRIVVDPVNRLIAFDLAPNYRQMKLQLDDLGPAHTAPHQPTTESGERHDPST